MGDGKSVIPVNEAEQHMVAAFQHFVKALAASKNLLSDDLKRILSELDTHLSTMSKLPESSTGQFGEVEEQLKSAEVLVMNWESNQSRIWDSGPREAADYLKAVDEVRRSTESLGSLSLRENGKRRELTHRAHVILQMAMARLEEELIHILVHKKLSFGCEYMSFHSRGKDVVINDESFLSVEEDETFSGRGDENVYDEYIIDLVHPDVISDLKSIANAMFASHYDQEFCKAFISIRKDALDEYLVILKIKKLSIEDVLKIEWSCLNRKIKRWIGAMKIIFRVYLMSEKWLCNQILGKYGSVHSTSFIEISKASVLHLLNFGEAIAMGPHGPEKLFRLLDMYEALSELLVHIDILFSVEAGSFLRTEFRQLVKRLGESARATFMRFSNAIASKTSRNPFLRGGVLQLTNYVMNYITTLTDYGDTLNMLLQDQCGQDSDAATEPENGQDNTSFIFCPVAKHLQLITSILEYNLECRSKLYKDDSLKHVFLMNNIHYMVQKVKVSELRTFLGDEWIRRHIGKFRQHARSYERSTWLSVLSLLKEDVGGSGLISLKKPSIKESLRRFSVAFEEIYKSQTGWSVPNLQLREDLQISISQNVIHAYRTFVGRNSSCIRDKYIKYTADDLENYLLHLFEGSPKSLNHYRRS